LAFLPCERAVTIIPPSDPDFDAHRQELSRPRAERGRSYDERADLTDLSCRTLSEIELGRPTFTLAIWLAFARALGASLDQLFETTSDSWAEHGSVFM
jgi:DNA-binding XRE family transcriptional regulator